jgi:uncharacterized damage-inducible protein DinB
MSRETVADFEAEYRRYKTYAEGAFAQLSGEQLNTRPGEISNSIAMIVWHLAGNFASRFTDFLTTDGEKPWRQREEEFAARVVSKPDTLAKWEAGWKVVLDTLASLNDDDLTKTVHIRRQPLTVREALLRSLAHASMHVGQIVYVGKLLMGNEWRYLSIPPGQSDAYNRNPTLERPEQLEAAIKEKTAG